MTPQEKREALEALIKSQGWDVLRQEMEKSILQAAYQLTDGANMSMEGNSLSPWLNVGGAKIYRATLCYQCNHQ